MTAIFNLDKSHSISNIFVVTKIWNNSMEVIGLTVDLNNKKELSGLFHEYRALSLVPSHP